MTPFERIESGAGNRARERLDRIEAVWSGEQGVNLSREGDALVILGRGLTRRRLRLRLAIWGAA